MAAEHTANMSRCERTVKLIQLKSWPRPRSKPGEAEGASAPRASQWVLKALLPIVVEVFTSVNLPPLT